MLAILAAVMVFLVAQRDGSLASVETVDFSSLTVRVVGLVFVIALGITFFRERLSQAIEAAMVWAVIALLLLLGYTYRFELQDVTERVLTELVPGHASTHGRVVEIARGRGGNFSVVTTINGARINMVLDTGATSVVLTHEAAKAAGLPLEVLAYTVSVDTANGRAHAAPITLDQLTIGGIAERAVPALIAQPGQLRSNLLGMTFLNRLESWEVRGDRLIMRSYP
jgi:aspartyl protease family protein